MGVGARPRRAGRRNCAAVEGRQPIVSHTNGTMEGVDALAKTMAPKKMAVVAMEACAEPVVRGLFMGSAAPPVVTLSFMGSAAPPVVTLSFMGSVPEGACAREEATKAAPAPERRSRSTSPMMDSCGRSCGANYERGGEGGGGEFVA